MQERYLIAVLFAMASAQASSKTVTVFGAGTTTCGAFLEASQEQGYSFVGYKDWLGGYLTAANIYKSRTIDIDIAGAAAWLRNYCQDHPLEDVATGASKLDSELDRKAIK